MFYNGLGGEQSNQPAPSLSTMTKQNQLQSRRQTAHVQQKKRKRNSQKGRGVAHTKGARGRAFSGSGFVSAQLKFLGGGVYRARTDGLCCKRMREARQRGRWVPSPFSPQKKTNNTLLPFFQIVRWPWAAARDHPCTDQNRLCLDRCGSAVLPCCGSCRSAPPGWNDARRST